MSKKNKTPPNDFTPEWSHVFDTDELDRVAVEIEFSANENECAALSRRFSVEKIENLSAECTISPAQGGLIHVTGTVRARVHQLCVVTQDPVVTDVAEPMDSWHGAETRALSFAKAKKERESAYGHAEVEILDDTDDPEPIINGCIDVGEQAAQFLALAIPLFPRKDGAVSALTDDDVKAGKTLSGRKNPFEALKDWKDKK